MARQAKFRDDGTITDVPTGLGENPELEKQLDLLQYPIDIANLAKLQRPASESLADKRLKKE